MAQTNKARWINVAKISVVILILMDVVTRFYAIHHQPQIPIPHVVIASPKQQLITPYLTQTGNTVAYNSVNLVARVEGYLQKINFADGSFIKKDDLLFVIEPEPYLAKLREAQASVAAQKAVYAYNSTEYARQQRMYRENATSLNNVEKWLAQKQEAEAELAKAIANQDIAEINYSYTQVTAPFNGRIGRHLVDTGNLVGNGAATVLATIDQLDPIYIYFNLNELDVITLRTAFRNSKQDDKIIKQVPVNIAVQNDVYKYEGKLDFVNTGLNASTGTLELRARLPNEHYPLIPGLFVQIRLALGPPKLQWTVPDIAVQYDQVGAYLLTVNAQNDVVSKRVTVGDETQGQRIILQGVDAKDRIIIDGLQNASIGGRVAPEKLTP